MTANRQSAKRIEASLRYLRSQWEQAPSFVRQWNDEWDEAERLSFAMEWNHTEATLAEMRQLAAAGALSERHRQALDDVESRVRKDGRKVRALAFEDMPAMLDSLEAQNASS